MRPDAVMRIQVRPLPDESPIDPDRARGDLRAPAAPSQLNAELPQEGHKCTRRVL
jgi:hypothetical protein